MVLTHQDMIRIDSRLPRRGRRTTTTRGHEHSAVHSGRGELLLAARGDRRRCDGALELDRATVVPLGVDHLVGRSVPDGAARPLGGRPYLLMVGTSFWHKNRVFSFVLRGSSRGRGGTVGSSWSAVTTGRRRHGLLKSSSWQGAVALRPRGRSRTRARDRAAGALSRRAACAVSVALWGFGFIPFEAAALGTACVYTDRPAMGELLPASGKLPSFDLEEAGEVRAACSRAATPAHTSWKRSRGRRRPPWDRTAAGYLDVYERASCRPKRRSAAFCRQASNGARPPDSRRVKRLVAAYRRSRTFRVAVDSALRAGTTVLGGVRRLRGRSRAGR